MLLNEFIVHDTFYPFCLSEIPLVLCAIASVFLLHQWGNSVIDLLAIGSSLEPKLGVPLLLSVLFHSHMFSSKDKDNDSHDMLVSQDLKLMKHFLYF